MEGKTEWRVWFDKSWKAYKATTFEKYQLERKKDSIG